eukprot:comp13172_c1_seq1/m.8522 comp13172_c1_seq1/g.8522  ORF comp13172_c1_seq1/g.8522 comp13172_c1_seq1/m.8522 type:complete len:107 (-) comp13172_c1_seq1:47-367(-)
MTKNGRYCTIVGDDGEIELSAGGVAVDGFRVGYRKFAGIFGLAPSYHLFLTDSDDHVSLDEIRGLVEDGKMRPVLDPTKPFTLETVGDMFAKIMTQCKGELVMKIV